MRVRVACLLFFLLACCCQAGTNDVARLKADMESATAGLDTALEKQKADALVGYGKALDALITSHRQQGDLETLLTIRAEKKRFDAEKTVDESKSTSAVVLGAMKKYRATIAKSERDRAVKGIDLMKQTIAQIEGVIKGLVVQDKIEEGLAARQEVETIRFVIADAESKLARVGAAKPAPAPAAERSAGKKSVWEKHQYQLISKECSWHEAKAACEKMGGHLVIVNSAKENSFLVELAGRRNVWVGYTDEAQEGVWRCVDGSKATFTGWDPNSSEPNNSSGNEHYAICCGGGSWNDVSEDIDCIYVCEWDR